MDESPQARAAYLRGVAGQLRAIADREIDFRRQAQLRALADGFERFAERIEQRTGC